MYAYSETDFCDAESGLDYIFGYMGAIYGASFNRHWEGMDLGLVRQVWRENLGRFLTYKPSLDFALRKLNSDYPPSALKFRDLCNAGPEIPSKPVQLVTHQKTERELAEIQRQKQIALQKLDELKREMKAQAYEQK